MNTSGRQVHRRRGPLTDPVVDQRHDAGAAAGRGVDRPSDQVDEPADGGHPRRRYRPSMRGRRRRRAPTLPPVGVGEVVGGIALVGVAVLIGLAITDNDEPETLTEAESTLVDPAAAARPDEPATRGTDASSESTSSESTAPDRLDRTDRCADTTESRRDAAHRDAATDVASELVDDLDHAARPRRPRPPAPPTTLSVEQRAAINVKVVNGGAASGAAGDVTAAIRFSRVHGREAPPMPRARVLANTVLYAPFQRAAAEAVNELVGAQPDNVLEVRPCRPELGRLRRWTGCPRRAGPRYGLSQ